MKRFEIVSIIGTGTSYDAELGTVDDPIRPNTTGSYVVLGQIGNRMLIKRVVPDGTAVTPTTLADLQSDDTDVRATSLTPAQRTAIKTFLNNNGIDSSRFDANGVDDRRKLLRFLLRDWLGWNMADFRDAISTYDVQE